MSDDPIRDHVSRVLRTIAPEADLDALDPSAVLRDALDLDSMDLLRFFVALRAEFGVEVPERDYPKLATMAGCVAYVSASGKG